MVLRIRCSTENKMLALELIFAQFGITFFFFPLLGSTSSLIVRKELFVTTFEVQPCLSYYSLVKLVLPGITMLMTYIYLALQSTNCMPF